MKKKRNLTVLLLLLCVLFSGCRGPHMLGEFLIRDLLSKEQSYPLILKAVENAEIPCLSGERDGFLEFPRRNLTELVFQVEQDAPFWAIAVRNQGHTALKVQIGRTELWIEPGENRWIYNARSAEAGEYSVRFSADQNGALNGSAELWQSDRLENLVPVYRMAVRIVKVMDGYFQAEPLENSEKSQIPESFYGRIPSENRNLAGLRNGCIAQLCYTGDFSDTAPYVLEEIEAIKILGTAADP